MDMEQNQRNEYLEFVKAMNYRKDPEPDDEIDILELLRVIAMKFSSIIAVSIVTGIITFLISTFLLSPKYESYVDIYVTNTNLQNIETD